MKKHHILTFLLASFFIVLSLHSAYAQTSIAGDQVCGANSSTKCTLENAKTIASAAMALVIKIGSALLVMFIVYRFITAWFMLRSGNAAAYKTATKDVGNAIVGFVIITAILGGLYVVVLQFLGVDASLLKLFTDAFVPHAYAAGEGLLPNPVGVFDLYDFILTLVKLVMSFFIYPALIVMWVWSGFAYVAAQGNPEALKKANQWLMWAVITTIVIFMTQGLLFALRGTVNNILPEKTASQQVSPTSVVVDECANKADGTVCGGSSQGTCKASKCVAESRDQITCENAGNTFVNGTCVVTAAGARCTNGATNPPLCTLCPYPKVLVGTTCTTSTNNPSALADGCGVVGAKVGDRCGTAFISYGTCQGTGGSLTCQEQTGLSDCSLLSYKGRPCSTPIAPYGVCDVKSTAWDNTSYCRAR